MTNEHDPELSELLNDLPTPDHGPDFWTDLDAALAAEPAPVTGAVDGGGTAAAAAADEIDLEPASVTNISSHPRFRRWGLALVSAAAVAIAAVIGVSVLNGGGDSDAPPVFTDGGGSTSTPDAPPSTIAPAPEIDYSQIVETIDLGTGTVAGFVPDGSAVFVVDDAPGEELGSEGAELLTLWVQPVDGGERSPAFDDGLTIETGGARFALDDRGNIGWAEYCDGYTCGLYMGQVQADGTVRAVLPITLPDEVQIETFVSDLAWGVDGTLYAVINGDVHMVNTVDMVAESLGTEGRLLVPARGAPGIAGGAGLAVLQSDVEIAEALGRRTADGITDVVWTPDTDTLLWFGSGMGTVTPSEPGGSTGVLLGPDIQVRAASFSPDGTAVAYSTIDTAAQNPHRLMLGRFGPAGRPAPVDVAWTPLGEGIVVGLLDVDNALALRDSDSDDLDAECGVTYDLWQVPLDGSAPSPLSEEPAGPVHFVLGPDQMIAGISECGDRSSVFVEDLANDNEERFAISAGQLPVDGGTAVAITDVAFAGPDGLLLVGATTAGSRVWGVDIETGDIFEHEYNDVIDATVGLEGELMVLGADYFFSVDDPTPLDGAAVPDLTATGPVAYNRDGQLWALGREIPLADFEAGRIFPSGRSNEFSSYTNLLAIESETIGLRRLETRNPVPGFVPDPADWEMLDPDGEDGYWTPDGSAFVYTARVENGAGGDKVASEVRVLRFD